MRKKAFLIIAAILLCVSNIMAQVASGVCGDNITWELTAEGELVIEGTGEMYNYSSNPAAPWSSYSGSIKSVNIEDGVTSIGSWAFAQCSALTDVSISESVTTIGGDAFRECSILEEINLPTGLTQLGTGVFLYCDALRTITVPEGVTKIGSDTFEFCPNLSSITFPSGLTEIGPWALKGAYNLASITCKATTPPSLGSEVFSGVNNSIPVYVPASSVEAYKAANGWSEFTNIQPIIIASGTCGDNLTWKYLDGNELVIEGTGEMYNYSSNSAAPWNSYRGSIKSINIKDGVTSIGSWAFAGCAVLTDVSISESVKTISNNAFRGCSILEGITLPTGLTQLGAEVFYECRNLKTATLPEGLSSIETSTFYHCGNLQSVVIPESVTSLGWGVFFGCGKLTSVTCNATTPPSCSDTSFFAFNIAACTLYVPDESESAYQQANYWKDFTKPLASGTCGDNLTWRLTYGDELVIEGTGEMTSTPWSIYSEQVSTVTLGEGVANISDWAFGYYPNLTSVAIPASVTTIGGYAFMSCSSLASVTIAENSQLATIGASTFKECSNLTSFTLPASVTAIEGDAFWRTGLTSFIIPENSQLATIGDWAFHESAGLATISFPASLTSIGYFAFYSCNFTSITCNAVTPPSAGNAFPSTDASALIYVPAVAVDAYKEADGWSAFTNIQPIIIDSGTCGDNLTWKYLDGDELVIEGTGDMYNYSNNPAAPWSSYRGSIKSVNIKDGVTSIGSWAFAQCSALTDVSISESVTTIGGDAFRECSILEEINLPTGLTQLGTGVFLYCDALRTITVPEGVTKIGSDTFEFCPNLSSITFPSGLTEIGPWALKGAYNLASITCKATTPPSLGSEVFSGVNNSIPVYVPASSVEAYKAANGWSAFTNIQPITIASGTCGEGLTWQIIDSGELIIEGTGEMTSAPWSEYKEQIYKITIKEGVTSICDGAFRDCNKVVTMTIPKGVTRLGWDVFFGCTGELFLNSLPQAGMMYDLFFGSEFTKIVIGEGITTISHFAFVELYSLKEIVLPESLTTIEDMAFAFSPNITTVICKGTVPPVCWENAFENREVGMTLYVPITATLDYKSAATWQNFGKIIGTEKCGEALTCELWPDGKLLIMGEGEITSAPWSTCRGLVKELIIEEGITGIADETFSSFENLLSITSYAEVPPLCSADAFAGVNKATPVYVPADKLEFYSNAEGWSDFFNLTSNNSRILLDNFAEYSNATDEDFDEITYKRTFNNTEWQALYVPFEIPVTEEFLAEFEVADLNDIRQYDRDDDGVADETVVEAFKITDGILEANYPYLIRAKETGEKNIIVTDATLYATKENSIDCSSVHERYTFTPTYSTIAASALCGCYALSSGVWQPIADDASLGAFRFYLSIESREGNMQAAQNIRMLVIGKDTGDDTTTGIGSISDTENEDPEMIYDMQGRRVTKPNKGIYIVNGKKVFIK